MGQQQQGSKQSFSSCGDTPWSPISSSKKYAQPFLRKTTETFREGINNVTINIYHLDDEIQILERFEKILSGTLLGEPVKIFGFEKAKTMESALAGAPVVDVFILDIFLQNGIDHGTRVTGICREKYPDSIIFVCSGAKDLKKIRSTLKEGANDFIAKESKPDEIIAQIEAALTKRLKTLPFSESKSSSHTGSTMSSVRLRMPNIINSAVNCVYVEGESGTGKEVVADCIATTLPKGTPFVKINCGSIPQALVASELFGHARGAFTGAVGERSGLIEAANGGWVFLDEIATLPPDAQVALLRAIDNQEIRRVGATKARPVNFRVISATNESLAELVEKGKFRRDLWQRLRETEIILPPLRKRRHEIPELIDFFCASMRGGPYQLAPTVLETLSQYSWKEGNIRELRNCLRAMTEKSINRILTPGSIPENVWESVERGAQSTEHDGRNKITLTWQSKERPSFDELSAKLLLEILRQEFRLNGKMSMRGAAKAAGIAKSSMPAKIKHLLDSKIIEREDLNEMIISQEEASS